MNRYLATSKVSSTNEMMTLVQQERRFLSRQFRDQVNLYPALQESYQSLFFFVYRFLLLSLSVCNKGKKMYLHEMAKLNSIKTEKL